jgi:membrane protein implicated in regulation of membrane protease activity
MLIYFGVSSLAVSGIMSLVSAYQLWILIAIIFLNLLSVYYFSGRIASAERRTQRREARASRKS